jgi:hypothetical protein
MRRNKIKFICSICGEEVIKSNDECWHHDAEKENFDTIWSKHCDEFETAAERQNVGGDVLDNDVKNILAFENEKYSKLKEKWEKKSPIKVKIIEV